MAVLARTHVDHRSFNGLLPGSARWFGEGARGHVRLSFATSRGILDAGLDRIETWLARRAGRPAM